MSFISVCKNVIYSNNKRNWVDPDPAIRVSKTASGAVQERGHTLAIKDKDGAIVARLVSSQDGKPVVSCGAKVAIITEFDAEIISN